jgi:cytochrome c oxidase subunit 2
MPTSSQSSSATRTRTKDGGLLHRIKGCNSCHSVDGSRGVGPSMKDYWGSERRLADGRVVMADDEYFRRAILEPSAEIVEGYPNQMQSYTGAITDQEISALAEFYRRISIHASASPASDKQSAGD